MSEEWDVLHIHVYKQEIKRDQKGSNGIIQVMLTQ